MDSPLKRARERGKKYDDLPDREETFEVSFAWKTAAVLRHWAEYRGVTPESLIRRIMTARIHGTDRVGN